MPNRNAAPPIQMPLQIIATIFIYHYHRIDVGQTDSHYNFHFYSRSGSLLPPCVFSIYSQIFQGNSALAHNDRIST